MKEIEMSQMTALRLAVVSALLAFVLACLLAAPDGVSSTRAASPVAPQAATQPASQCARLPVPSAVGVVEFERRLIEFLKGRCYQKWTADREIRDTGPFVGGVYYGTHPAVRVFYSPEMWDWTKKREQRGFAGDAPDGAVVIKEQFTPPASPDSPLTGWSIMVRDEKGSWDGWYWSGHAVDPKYDSQMVKFDPLKIDYKGQGFGTYCIRCHASAVKQTSTFSTVRNVEDDPISYMVLVPTFLPPTPTTQLMQPLSPNAQPAHAVGGETVRSPHDDVHPLVLAANSIATPAGVPTPVPFPSENFDHVYSGQKGPPQFVTSDQCIGCHTASDINMSATFKNPPVNISPYTEWRASMMGLAGRDPIFHAQVESERAQFANSPLGNKDDFLDTKCFHCHGVMGQRQLVIDNLAPGQPVPPGGGMSPPFKHDYVYAMPDTREAKYGALARDGISCAVCHQMADANPKLGTEASYTGNFSVDKPGTMNGPYKDVQPLPMKHSLGVTPEHAPQITSSALCGTCHTVVVPVFDKDGKQLKDDKTGKPLEFHEQTTYLEWLDSDYQNEPELSKRPVKIADVQTCQDCHMPKTYAGLRVKTRVANIEDNTYPFVDFRLPDKDLRLNVRDDFSRHTLVALNVFANQMFQQFSGTLGIATGDYMYPVSASGATPVPGLVTTQNSMLELAEQTAGLDVVSISRTPDALEVAVKVTNLAGHSFPSGVEFRRGFLEFVVLDAAGRPLWASGRTNAKGEIVEGMTERVLPTEFFDMACKDPKLPPASCKQECEQKFDPARCIEQVQPHFFGTRYPITRGDEVQIYEELVKDNDGLLTNSFVRLFEHVKDNRLLPKGWRPDAAFAEFTGPYGRATEDPGFISPDFAQTRRGSEGSSTVVYRIPLKDLKGAPASVQATLQYQTIPPYYLRDRFSILGHGLPDDRTREARRLKYFTDYLNVAGTPVEDWKLTIKCARRSVGDGLGQLCAATN
jgi:hypothetical protein